MCPSGARGHSRGALVLNSPKFECQGNTSLCTRFRHRRWQNNDAFVCVGPRKVCVCVCVGGRLHMCWCVRQADSAQRLNESYNVNQAQSN